MRRRREEIQTTLESLGESDSGTVFDADDYEARVRELKTLNKQINDLQKKSAGLFTLQMYQRRAFSFNSLFHQNWRKRMINSLPNFKNFRKVLRRRKVSRLKTAAAFENSRTVLSDILLKSKCCKREKMIVIATFEILVSFQKKPLTNTPKKRRIRSVLALRCMFDWI